MAKKAFDFAFAKCYNRIGSRNLKSADCRAVTVKELSLYQNFTVT